MAASSTVESGTQTGRFVRRKRHTGDLGAQYTACEEVFSVSCTPVSFFMSVFLFISSFSFILFLFEIWFLRVFVRKMLSKHAPGVNNWLILQPLKFLNHALLATICITKLTLHVHMYDSIWVHNHFLYPAPI